MTQNNNDLKFLYNSIALIRPDDPTLILDMDKVNPENVAAWQSNVSYEYIILELDLNSIYSSNNDSDNIETIKKYLLDSLYINGILIKDQKTEKKYALIKKPITSNYPIIFNLYVNEASDIYEFSFDLKIYQGTIVDNNIQKDENHVFEINVWHASKAMHVNLYDKHGVHIGENNKTCMLVRTNPLLTGNVRVIVENDNIYFDTFKEVTNIASTVTSKKTKSNVSPAGIYGANYYNATKHIPRTSLFSLRDEFYIKDILTNDTDINQLKNQYIDTYDYGTVENKNDIQYQSKLKILAPLYLENVVPDYFVIFRNPLATSITKNIDNNFIKNSNIIKIIDLRPHTNTGAYLKKQCELYTQYALRNIKYNESGMDTYSGIRMGEGEGGVVTNNFNTSSEYPRNLIENAKQHEQIAYRALRVFDDNNIVNPNIINLEFMFNDDTADDFKLYNYFGLYVFEHELLHIVSTANANFDYKLVDNDKVEHTVNELADIIENPNTASRLYSLSNNKSIHIIKDKKDIVKYLTDCIVNSPGEIIGSTFMQKLDIQKKTLTFITMKFSREIHAGDHFRIIKPDSGSVDAINGKCTVYELIASSDERLLRYSVPVGRYVLTNKVDKIDIYSIPVYMFDRNDNTKYATLEELIKRINVALFKLNQSVKLHHISEDTIAIYSSDPVLYFLHIIEPNVKDDIDYIHYYNPEHITKLKNYHVYDNTDNYYAYNNPITEVNTVRLSSIVKFLKTDIFLNSLIYEICNSYDYELSGITIPKYKAFDGKFYSLNAFDITENIAVNNDKIEQNKVYGIISPYNVSKRIISVNFPVNDITTTNNLYYSPVFKFNVLGLCNIKDITPVVENTNSDTSTNTYDNILQIVHISMNKTIKLSKNTELNIRKIKEIQLFRTYLLTSGSFLGAPLLLKNTLIIFINEDWLLYKTPNSTEYRQFRYSIKDNNNTISVNSDEVILKKVQEDGLYANAAYNYTYPINTLNWNRINNDLLIPEVPNLSVLYDKTYVNKLNQKLTKTISFDAKSNTEPLFNVYNDDIDVFLFSRLDKSAYSLKYSLNDRLYYKGQILTVRDYILSGAQNAMTLLYKKYLHTSIVYQDAASHTAEFIYHDIKFNMKFSTDTVYADVDVNSWNLDGYEAILIFDYDLSKNTEIFVSYDEKLIIIFEHKTNQYNKKNRARHIKILEDNTFKSASYYWHNAPFNYEFINAISLSDDNFILHKDYMNSIYNDNYDTDYLLVQAGYPIYNHIADFSETGYMCTLNYMNVEHINNNYDKLKNLDIFLSKNINNNTLTPVALTVIPKSFYQYFLESSRYTEKHPEYINMMNDEDGLIYDMVDKTDKREYHTNILKEYNNLIKLTELQDIINVLNNKNYILHYIHNGIATTTYIDEVYNAIDITAETVQLDNINCYYTLHKEDIISFDLDDPELSELTNVDLTYANTKIPALLPVILRTINPFNGGTNRLINQHLFANPFSKSAGSGYYNNNKKLTFNTQGYWPKMFFGSTCMLVTPYLKVVIPTYENVLRKAYTATNTMLTIYPLIILKDILANNETFKSNWQIDDNQKEYNTYMSNYIENTLKYFYDIELSCLKANGDAMTLTLASADNKWDRIQYNLAEDAKLISLIQVNFKAYNQ